MPSFDRDREDSGRNKSSLKKPFMIAGAAAAGVTALVFAIGSPVTVDTNEVACFRTFGVADCNGKVPAMENGQPVMEDGKPVMVNKYYDKGLHFKMPFITTVDKLKISQRLTAPEDLKVTLGQQNQPATVTYQTMVSIPRGGMRGPDGKWVDSVYNLLYNVGSAGAGNVDGVVDQVIGSALNSAFGPIEPDEASAQRNQILGATSKDVGGKLARLGVQMDSEIMVKKFELEGAWKEAANTRVLSIGKKQAAQNEADAAKLAGQGKGEGEQAEAQGHAAAMNAKADADAAYIKRMREAFGGDDNALAIYMLTQSKTALPQVMGDRGIQVVPNFAPQPK
jgi:regulator of protease activity HflC (stomatin/prohibitin superfamily)